MEEILRMNNKKDVNQLLIIGNGFDLQCGLKSSFKNYFKYGKEK
ncbi:AbiH family protein, partial [Ligilactobacillus aviarius]